MSHAKQLHHRRYLNDYLEIINREGLPGNVKSDLCLQVQDTVIATVQHVIEEALAEELYTYLGLARYEHLPWGRPHLHQAKLLDCLTRNHGFRPRARPPYHTRILQSTGDSFGAFFFVCRAT